MEKQASGWKSTSRAQDSAYFPRFFLLGELQPRDWIPGASILVSVCGLSGSHPYDGGDCVGDLDPCIMDSRDYGKSTGS